MADVTSERKEIAPNLGAKAVLLKSGTTLTGGTDTLTMTLANYGITNVLSVSGVVHTTDYSVIVSEAGTTAVSAGVLTYTTAAGNDNKRRVVVVYGE